VDGTVQFFGRDLLAGLSGAERRLFEQRCRRRQYRRHSIIFNQGDPAGDVFLIERGWIKSFYTSYTGKEITIGLWSDGDLVGTTDIDQPTRLLSCQAVADSILLGFGSAEIDHFLNEGPAVVRKLVTALSFKVRWATTICDRLATESVTSRVAHTVITLANLHGVRGPGNRFRLERISHQDIARMIGASRQSVTLAFAKFQKEGLVSCSKRCITVHDLDALAGERLE
jgi:CRP-like cAMP-binding protein